MKGIFISVTGAIVAAFLVAVVFVTFSHFCNPTKTDTSVTTGSEKVMTSNTSGNVKIFKTSGKRADEELEKKINGWLEKNPNITILSRNTEAIKYRFTTVLVMSMHYRRE